jgi:endoglucanase
MNRWLNTLFVAIACVLALPAVAQAQFPSPTYGWNLGNTLEPPCGEGCWAPAATQAMINKVADSGFNSIRIPVAWNSNANQSTYQISSTWLNRVKQVVDWSLDAGLTVVVNTHWDGGWLENNIGNTVNPTINAKMNSYWTQIANTFASYDERLLFAAANEPNADTAAEMSTLTAYYQTFVNAVRGTGGGNTSRWLVVQGPNTNIDLTNSLMNTLPNDPTADRLAVEVHYYDPWQFAGLDADANDEPEVRQPGRACATG